MQAEVWLEVLSVATLHSIVHTPVTAFAEYLDTIDAYDQMWVIAIRYRGDKLLGTLLKDRDNSLTILLVGHLALAIVEEYLTVAVCLGRVV